MSGRGKSDAEALEELNRAGAKIFSQTLPAVLEECARQGRTWAETAAIVAALFDRLRDEGLVVRIGKPPFISEALLEQSLVRGPEGLQ
ncbi:MAG: hypothetical protein MUF27_01925 [Acidobacteria bacterium]|nr:hypothetical protein [Acidobacteriota bacterium]